MENLLFLGVPILKHITVCFGDLAPIFKVRRLSIKYPKYLLTHFDLTIIVCLYQQVKPKKTVDLDAIFKVTEELLC